MSLPYFFFSLCSWCIYILSWNVGFVSHKYTVIFILSWSKLVDWDLKILFALFTVPVHEFLCYSMRFPSVKQFKNNGAKVNTVRKEQLCLFYVVMIRWGMHKCMSFCSDDCCYFYWIPPVRIRNTEDRKYQQEAEKTRRKYLGCIPLATSLKSTRLIYILYIN